MQHSVALVKEFGPSKLVHTECGIQRHNFRWEGQLFINYKINRKRLGKISLPYKMVEFEWNAPLLTF
jgi:hypothetical protein